MFHKVCTVADNDMILTEEVLKECRQKPKLNAPEDPPSEDSSSDLSKWEGPDRSQVIYPMKGL